MLGAERLLALKQSLDPEIENVKPPELQSWLREIESNWDVIPELETSPKNLHSLTIICDGNRRAAEERELEPFYGHRAGVETIKGISRACRQWDIPYLTFWTWSTENWKRSENQVQYVMGLAINVLTDQDFVQELVDNQVRFVHLGRRDRLPEKVVTSLKELEEKTKGFDKYWLNLAMDYGGLDEVARAIVDIAEMVQDGQLSIDDVRSNPEVIYNFLDTKGQPNPDLIVRTGVKDGEIPHTSGLMPLQSAYACWDFVPNLFPNLTPDLLGQSLIQFAEYERRFGE